MVQRLLTLAAVVSASAPHTLHATNVLDLFAALVFYVLGCPAHEDRKAEPVVSVYAC